MKVKQREVLRLVWTSENRGFRKRLRQLQVKNNQFGWICLAFGGLMWTVENAAKRLKWTKNVLSLLKKEKKEGFENALVWTGRQSVGLSSLLCLRRP